MMKRTCVPAYRLLLSLSNKLILFVSHYESPCISLPVYVSVCQFIHMFYLDGTLTVGVYICLSAGISVHIHPMFGVLSACWLVCLSVGQSSCHLDVCQLDCQSCRLYIILKGVE